MTPVIRVDDQVMDELKKRAVVLGLVFEPPNATLRRVLGLDNQGNGNVDKFVDIQMRNSYTPLRWAIIPIPKVVRRFFPGFELPFVLETDVGEIKTHITSAPKGTPMGDPDNGTRIQSGLRKWFDAHRAQLSNGVTLHIETLEPGKRYKLSVVSKGV